MENSVRKSDGCEIPEGSKSLDMQSVHDEKSMISLGQRESKALRRKRRLLVEEKTETEENLNKWKTKRKHRKQVCLSSFDSVTPEKVEDDPNAVDVIKFSDVKENNFSLKLDDNLVPVPRRPRGTSRRKKSQNVFVLDDTAVSSKNISSEAQIVKFTGESVISLVSSEGLRNSSGKTANGDSTKNRNCRNSGKEELGRNSVKEVDSSVGDSGNTSSNVQDDEGNLAHSADPSFSGSPRNFSASPSGNDNSMKPSFSGVVSTRVDLSAGSESNSIDAAGRVLRPRMQYKEKGHVRKRRHFYELLFKDLDARWVVNRKIKVFWPLDNIWYFGIVKEYDPEKKLHHIKYDDRDEEWIDLQRERFKLLLLPSEVPHKSWLETSAEGKQVNGEGDMDVEDDDCGLLDSEPIVTWLSRLTHRNKSSPFDVVKRQKTLSGSKNNKSIMSYDDSVATPSGCLIAGSFAADADYLSGEDVTREISADGNMAEKSLISHNTSWKDRKLPFVYSRRRLRKKPHGLDCKSKDSSWGKSIAGFHLSSDTFLDNVLEEFDTSLCGYGPDHNYGFWTGKDLGCLRFCFSLVDMEKVRVNLRISLKCAYWVIFGADSVCFDKLLLLKHHLVMMTVWPKVRLEMLFVDNVVGLRFMLFEGCMMQAVSLVCSVLAIFYKPNGREKFVDLQLPVTSIRFKLSGFGNLERHLIFVSYSFLELDDSNWEQLDEKLNRYCSIRKQLPLHDCTLDNIKVIQSRSNQLCASSLFLGPSTTQVSRRRLKQNIMHIGFSKEFANISTGRSSSNSDEKSRKFPSFVLPFAAAPSFFVSLHLKLLMEKKVASISFQKRHSISLVEDSEDHLTQSNPAVEELVDQVRSKVEIDDLSISNRDNWIESSESRLNSVHNVTTVSSDDHELGKCKNVLISSLGCQSPDHSGSEQFKMELCPSASDDHTSGKKSESGHLSQFGGITVQIPQDIQSGTQSLDRGRLRAQQSISDFVSPMNESNSCSPNPTAHRSMWHRNNNNLGSSSFGSRLKTRPDERSDLICNDLDNGSENHRSRVSSLLPIGGYDLSSKPRSHQRNGRSHKKTRKDNEKTVSSSRSPRILPEFLSCDSNVLITNGDRGWREYGAQVVLEFVDHKDWQILVKLSGVTKYSHKAHQFLQPGSVNRHTHAMMWKGEKDWILEFPDRSQWARFKEIYEECYDRNIRSTSVKTIPIPGVRLIEESDDVALGVPFVRCAPKYYMQAETDIEMALDPSHVLYDMDSDDEQWVSRYRNSAEFSSSNISEVSVEMFERVMYLFEGVAYLQHREDFALEEIEEITVELGPVDVIKAIHEHWQHKRQTKGMPLIRHLQPPAWERYQKQLKEWEMSNYKIHNLPNGCTENTIVPLEKPAMFAFCLKPRGLRISYRGSKPRSHRKLTSGGHSYVFPRDQDGIHFTGRRSNGLEERGVHDFSDSSHWHQTSRRVSSPRDASGSGYLSMSSDGSEKNQRYNYHRNKVRKMNTLLSTNESEMMTMYNPGTGKRNGSMGMSYNQRTGKRINPSTLGLSEGSNERNKRPRVEKLDDSDLDEFKLRDASGAARHASIMAKLKRERAQKLLYRADVAVHKATVALMIAEAIKAPVGAIKAPAVKELTDNR